MSMRDLSVKAIVLAVIRDKPGYTPGQIKAEVRRRILGIGVSAPGGLNVGPAVKSALRGLRKEGAVETGAWNSNSSGDAAARAYYPGGGQVG